MDVMSEVLQSLELQSTLDPRPSLRAPWGLLRGESGRAVFHVVREGSCVAWVDGCAPLALGPGDLLLVPRGTTHRLASASGALPVDWDALMAERGPAGLAKASIGGKGEETVLVSGTFDYQRDGVHPLLSQLPERLVVRTRRDPDAAHLRATVDFVLNEALAPRQGTDGILQRAVDILFIQVLRHYAGTLPETEKSWLNGMRDPRVGAALACIHNEPERDWTVEELARRAGLSRSAFAARFKDSVGETPLRYLHRWRIQKALSRMRGSRATLKEIAGSLGYPSDVAFHRTFKKFLGVSPGRYRRQAVA